MLRKLALSLLLAVMVLPASAQLQPKLAGGFVSTTGTLSGSWEPMEGSGGTAIPNLVPQYIGLMYSTDGTGNPGTWAPCTSSCFGGGSMIWPTTPGITVCTGTPCTAWGTSLAAPSGTIVGTTDTQTLTNKIIDGVTPTVMGYVDPTSSIQTQLNGKQATLTNPVTGPGSGAVVGHLAVMGNTSGTSITDGGAVPTALPPNGAAGGDLSGSYPSPGVAKINGVALSGLATGPLYNTTSTGAPSIETNAQAIAALGSNPVINASAMTNFPTFNQNTTGTAANLTAAATLPTGMTMLSAAEIGTAAEYSNGTCTTAKTVTPVNGNMQNVTLTNSDTCALTFTQPSSGTASITLKVIQSSTSTFNGTISGCKWPAKTVPTITATTGAIDFVSIYLDGTNAFCAILQNFG